jgi:hypothetical protein
MQSQYQPEREVSTIKRMAGSREAAEETYVDLYEHNVWLRDLTRWDWAAPFLAAGTMALGAAGGAIAAGASAGSKGVIPFWVAGAILLACGVVLKDRQSKDIRKGYEEFDRRLCLYDEEPRAQAIRARLDAQAAKQAAEHTLRAKLQRLRERM